MSSLLQVENQALQEELRRRVMSGDGAAEDPKTNASLLEDLNGLRQMVSDLRLENAALNSRGPGAEPDTALLQQVADLRQAREEAQRERAAAQAQAAAHESDRAREMSILRQSRDAAERQNATLQAQLDVAEAAHWQRESELEAMQRETMVLRAQDLELKQREQALRHELEQLRSASEARQRQASRNKAAPLPDIMSPSPGPLPVKVVPLSSASAPFQSPRTSPRPLKAAPLPLAHVPAQAEPSIDIQDMNMDQLARKLECLEHEVKSTIFSKMSAELTGDAVDDINDDPLLSAVQPHDPEGVTGSGAALATTTDQGKGPRIAVDGPEGPISSAADGLEPLVLLSAECRWCGKTEAHTHQSEPVGPAQAQGSASQQLSLKPEAVAAAHAQTQEDVLRLKAELEGARAPATDGAHRDTPSIPTVDAMRDQLMKELLQVWAELDAARAAVPLQPVSDLEELKAQLQETKMLLDVRVSRASELETEVDVITRRLKVLPLSVRLQHCHCPCVSVYRLLLLLLIPSPLPQLLSLQLQWPGWRQQQCAKGQAGNPPPLPVGYPNH